MHVYPSTESAASMQAFSPWYLLIDNELQELPVENSRVYQDHLVVKIEGCDQREDVSRFTNQLICINREQLPTLINDDIYWADLYGLSVETKDGTPLGVIDHMINTGANDIMVVTGDRDRWIPYTEHTIVTLDLPNKIVVDWDPEF